MNVCYKRGFNKGVVSITNILNNKESNLYFNERKSMGPGRLALALASPSKKRLRSVQFQSLQPKAWTELRTIPQEGRLDPNGRV